jgi:hypothetical protein
MMTDRTMIMAVVMLTAKVTLMGRSVVVAWSSGVVRRILRMIVMTNVTKATMARCVANVLLVF